MPQRATGTVTTSTASAAAPASVRRSLSANQARAADHRGEHAAARGGQREAEHEQREGAAPGDAAGALRRAREPQCRGRRERRVGADRVRVAEHALQPRRGLEEHAVRALLDRVGDERQRGGAEHPRGALEWTAEQAGEQGTGRRGARGHEPAVGVAIGRLRRQRPGDRGVGRERGQRECADVDLHPARRQGGGRRRRRPWRRRRGRGLRGRPRRPVRCRRSRLRHRLRSRQQRPAPARRLPATRPPRHAGTH